MTTYRLMIAAASAALLLGTAGFGAGAAEIKASVAGVNAKVTVGGGSTAQAKASVGNTAKANVTVGGGGGNVATAKANVGNNTVTASVATGNGPLVTSTTSGNPLGGGLTSGTSINLGGLFGGGGSSPGGVAPGDGGDGIGGGGGNGGGGDGGGGNGGGVIVIDQVAAATAGMSAGEIAAMKRRCISILATPFAYDDSLVDLCRVLRRL